MPEWLEVVIRSLLFVVVLFLITKWLGKKQLSELSFFEYVVGITIGSIGAEVITGLERNMFNGIIGIVVFSGNTLFSRFAFLKKQRLSQFYRRKSNCIYQRWEDYGR